MLCRVSRRSIRFGSALRWYSASTNAALNPSGKYERVEETVKQLDKAGTSTLIYTAPPAKYRPYLSLAAAIFQLGFWGQMAYFIDTIFKFKNKETGEYKAPSKRIRYVLSTMSVVLGVIFTGGLLWIPSRFINKIIYLPRKKQILVETPHMVFGTKWFVATPKQVSLAQRAYTGQGKFGASRISPKDPGYITMRKRGQRLGYLIHRNGEFSFNAAVLDQILYK